MPFRWLKHEVEFVPWTVGASGVSVCPVSKGRGRREGGGGGERERKAARGGMREGSSDLGPVAWRRGSKWESPDGGDGGGRQAGKRGKGDEEGGGVWTKASGRPATKGPGGGRGRRRAEGGHMDGPQDGNGAAGAAAALQTRGRRGDEEGTSHERAVDGQGRALEGREGEGKSSGWESGKVSRNGGQESESRYRKVISLPCADFVKRFRRGRNVEIAFRAAAGNGFLA